ncbi:MAG: transcription termination factor Rho [Lachnospiraceae bacterium]|nr:transcription termination factor Rho [Lachnospiraceae bacterium]MBD5498551.1 transcription termination factor Rho [Lachnospiraceae bacterium]
MREKYESLALADLKGIAKARGMKGVSTMKKAQLVEAMLAQDEKDKAAKQSSSAGEEQAGRQEEKQQEGRVYTERKQKERSHVERKSEERSYANGEKKPEERVYAERKPEERRYTERKPEERRYAYEERKQEERRVEERGIEERRSVQAAGSEVHARPVQNIDRNAVYDMNTFPPELDSGQEANGILEVMPDGYGFIRCANYMPGENDVYVAPSQIRRFGLKTGDILVGNKRTKTQQEKFSALLYIKTINGFPIEVAMRRRSFEDMTPIFPDERIRLEVPGASIAMRVMDMVSPIGKGQRGMIVSPPKAGKTTLLKQVAKSILRGEPNMHMLILLIDERPEEVTDIKEAIEGENVEVIYSTFDELPEHHKRVSEMVIERAKRLVEHGMDVVILLDSITRLTRAYNQVVPPSGRTLSGGLDPAALHMPKRFFGAARNLRGGGSLTILATALVETGSKMDDVVYEEFKGTGNMEMVLDRKLSEKRIFPAIDLQKSGTRREDLLLNTDELEAINIMRKALNGMKADEAADRILDMFSRTRNNQEFVNTVKKMKFI